MTSHWTEGTEWKTVDRVCLVMIKDLDEDEQELVLIEMKCFVKEIIDELYKNEELEDDIPLDWRFRIEWGEQ